MSRYFVQEVYGKRFSGVNPTISKPQHASQDATRKIILMEFIEALSLHKYQY